MYSTKHKLLDYWRLIMKKRFLIVLCTASVISLCACGNNREKIKKQKFDSEYSDDHVTFKIMKDWVQTGDDYCDATWTNDDGLRIEYSSYISSSGVSESSEEMKQKWNFSTNSTCETKKIGDYDCLIKKINPSNEDAAKEYNNEVVERIRLCPNGLYCTFTFPESAENTVIKMIKSLEIKSLSDKEYSTLDTDWESSYIKFDISSKWLISDEYDSENYQSVEFEWLTNEYGCHIDLSFFEGSYYKKTTTYELEQDWSDSQNHKENDPDLSATYDDSLKITDSFVENGVPFIVISSDDPNTKEIEFENDGIKGIIRYNIACEDVVMNLISTMEFYK